MTAALHTLLSHAERQRDQVLGALLQTEEHLRRLQQQEEQLLAYRGEYHLRHPATGGRTSSIEVLRYHEGFMQRLDQALAQQRAQVQQCTARCQELRATLVAEETHVASVRRLLERRDAQALRVEARQEQRHSDETAMQQYRRRSDEAGSWHLGAEPLPAH